MKDQVIKGLEPMAQYAKQKQAMQSNVALQGVTYKPTNGKSEQWTTEDVGAAVRDIADMIEKTQVNFIMLGDLARAIRDKRDSFMTKAIQVGMLKQGLTVEVKSLFKTWGFEEISYGYKYYFTPPIRWSIKVPVEIHVIKKNYKFLINPDRGWFGVDDLLIPNPFEDYWKIKQLV